MADAKATVSLTPRQVDAGFVDRYYLLLRDSPEEIFEFYQDSSMVSRLGPDDTMTTFTTIEDIRKHLLPSFHCKQCHIVSCDSQPAANQGVFVVVTGSFTTKDEHIFKFNQSFILTQTVDSYLISNDILRVFDEKERTLHVSTWSSTTDLFPEQGFSSTLPIEDDLEAVSSLTDFGVPSLDIPAVISNSTQADLPIIYIEDVSGIVLCPTEHEVPSPEDDLIAVSSDESSLDNEDVPKADQHEVETPDIPAVISNSIQHDGPIFCMEDFPAMIPSSTRHVPTDHIPKKSFVSMVKILNENNVKFKPAPVRKPIQILQEPKKSGFEEKKKSMKEENGKGDGTSIFVGNLAIGSKPEQLYEAFKRFGRIKLNGVQIKLDRLCNPYAFIQFESSTSANAAIQASFIKIGDRKLSIKEKKHIF